MSFALDFAAGITHDQAAAIALVVLCFLYFLVRFPATCPWAVRWMKTASSVGGLMAFGLVGLFSLVPPDYDCAVALSIMVSCCPSLVRWVADEDLPSLQAKKGAGIS